MQILVVSDAWFPQVNGVVRTLDMLRVQLESLGHRPTFLTPDRFSTLPCPSYPQIRLALPKPGEIDRLIADLRPSAIHRDRGTPRLDCPMVLPPPSTAVHHVLP